MNHRYTLRQIKDGTGFAPDTQFETVEDFHGWTNRETWAVALHINNDQGWQESVHEALRAALPVVDEASNGPDAPFLSVHEAGEIISEAVADYLDVDNYEGDLDAFARGPLLAIQDIGSLWRVNWTELGTSFLADIADA